MRVSIALAVVLLGSVSATLAEETLAAMRQQTNIPPQPLGSALQALAKERKFQIVYVWDELQGLSTQGAVGEFSAQEAVTELLRGTGFTYKYLGEQTVTIVPLATQRRKPVGDHERAKSDTADVSGAALDGQNRSFGDRLRLAQADPAANSARSWSNDAGGQLEEIVVTAQKREERLRDVPISIVAMSADELQKRKVTSLDDLGLAVPGVSLASNGSFSRQIMMRGIANGAGSSSLIGLYLDEAPVTSANPGTQLDLRTYDLERVEVLRGPQGTLYGEGSAGGTIRFITRDPQLDGFAMNADIAALFTREGAPGQRIESVVNVPVNEVLGFRVAGTFDHQGGWIDQPAIDREDFNEQNLTNMRVKGLWRPSDEFQVSAMAILHRNDSPPSNAEDAAGNFTQVFNLSSTPDVSDDYDLFNLTLTYDLPAFQILSTTTYLDQDKELRNYGTHRQLAAPPAAPFDLLYPLYVAGGHNFTQELRLTSGGAGPWKWTAGAFYRDVTTFTRIPGYYFGVAGPPGSPLPGPAFTFFSDVSSQSWAAFGDSSYQLTERLSLGAGLRYFEDDQLDVQSGDEGSFHSLNPRAYAQFKLTDRINTYLSAGKGFRSGGFNPPAGSVLRPKFDPESIWTYELGAKLSTARDRLSADVALFYSDYEDYQVVGIVLIPQPANITSNAGTARVRGIEWAFSWVPADGWRLGLTGDYVDSEFVEINATAASHIVGDALDRFPKYHYTVSGQRDFAWLGRPGFLRLDYNQQGRMSFRNRRTGPWYFSESDVINMLNFNMSVQWNDKLSFSLFGQNLLDDRGYTGPNVIEELSARARPRTLGVAFGVTFD